MVKQKKHYLDELSDDLSLELGRAVWVFARLEKLLFDYTNQLSKERDLNELLGFQTIEKRIEILKKLTENTGLNSEKQEVLACLEEVKKLSKSRNQIAHNPWFIWIDFDQREFKAEIRAANNNKPPIDKKKMIKFAKEADELAVRLQNSMIPIVKVVRRF